MSDIKKYAVEETGVLHLKDANGDLMYNDGTLSAPCKVTLYGPGSRFHAQAQAVNNNKLMERMRNPSGKIDQSADERIFETAEFLARCTKDFSNIEYDNLTGQELFKAVYSDISIGFIANQVNQYIGNWANFTKS